MVKKCQHEAPKLEKEVFNIWKDIWTVSNSIIGKYRFLFIRVNNENKKIPSLYIGSWRAFRFQTIAICGENVNKSDIVFWLDYQKNESISQRTTCTYHLFD